MHNPLGPQDCPEFHLGYHRFVRGLSDLLRAQRGRARSPSLPPPQARRQQPLSAAFTSQLVTAGSSGTETYAENHQPPQFRPRCRLVDGRHNNGRHARCRQLRREWH